jgi:hypothetical protein
VSSYFKSIYATITVYFTLQEYFMKIFYSFLTLITYIFTCSFSAFAGETDDEQDSFFIVTAYYSPLPDQKHYLTGNYEDEIILNGQWIAGASGKKVFSGMLAAPWKYSFGTKIYLDGLGIGEVSDRGGAIVAAGQRWYSYDRIDVWMWYGDEWLKRALFWGKRKVYGHVVDSGNAVTLKYDTIPSPESATTGLKKIDTIKVPSIFEKIINISSSSEDIQELQIILSKLWYLAEDKVNGKFESDTISALYDFQIRSKIISNESDIGAWNYWPKTRKELQKLYEAYEQFEAEKQLFLSELEKYQDSALQQAGEKVKSLEKPIYWEISSRVRELQKTLDALGYFPYKDTAIFGIKTQNALIEYQLSKDIIENKSELWAGSFGPQTRAQLHKDLSELYLVQTLKDKKLYDAYKKYILWEEVTW